MTGDREALREEVARALTQHRPTRGMKVSMGSTCACGWWSESPDAVGDARQQRDRLVPSLAHHQADAVLAVVQPHLEHQYDCGVLAGTDSGFTAGQEKALREAADWFMDRDGSTHVVDALCQRRLTGEYPDADAGPGT